MLTNSNPVNCSPTMPCFEFEKPCEEGMFIDEIPC